MSRDEYNMMLTSGYPSPFGETPSAFPPFPSDPFQDSLSDEKDDFETKERISVVVMSVVMIGLLGLAVFIYVETSRTDESSGEGVAVDIIGSKGFGGGPGPSLTTSHGPRTSAATRSSSTAPPEGSTTELPIGPQIARDFLNYALNQSFAPCDDFYNYACGNYRYHASAVNKLMLRTEIGIRSTLSHMYVPHSFQTASQKAAGMYKACVSLASNSSGYQLEPVKALLSNLRLDISNMDKDPFFNIPHRVVYLSCVYGFPTFVKFSVHWTIHGKHLGVEIHKADEKWLNDQHKKARSQLLQFYRGFLLAYDSNINSTVLADSIFNLEVTIKSAIEVARLNTSSGTISLTNFGRDMRAYYDEGAPPSELEDAKRLGRIMKRTMVDKIRKTRWIRGSLFCMMNTKAKAVPIDMGYPAAVSGEAMLENLFHVRGDFTAPFLEMRRVQTLHTFRKNFDLNWNIAVRNAVYAPRRPLVSIYAGMLQPPIFIYNAPAAMNYGGLGQLTGHELMHGFDPNVIHFDRWTRPVRFEHTRAKKLYTGKLLCLRNAYYQAESEGRGRRLEGLIDAEGFVDYAGIQMAYEAFKNLPEHERTATVPGIDLTADQIFFVSHCLKWCTGVPGSKRAGGSRYWHGRSRCIVPLRNMPEFSEAFKCKRGDRMNPETRCSFW